jgi:S-layer domain protein
MKKTILSIIMVFALVFSFMPSMAADSVSVNMDMFEAMFTNLGNNLTELSAEDRVDIFTIGKNYLTTELGIETVKKVLNGELTGEIADEINKMLDVIGGKSTYKNELIMFLDFIDAFGESVRTQYINDFQARKAYTLSSSVQISMKNVYNRFVSADVQEMLSSSHGVTGNVILNVFDALKGKIYLTDNKTDNEKIALKSLNSSFESKLDEKWADIKTVNGNSVTGAEDIITALIDSFNDGSTSKELQDIKNVFEEMGIYSPLETPTPTPKPTKKPSTGTGGNGTIYVPTSTPTTTPVVTVNPIPVPQPAAEDEIAPDMAGHWAKDYVSAVQKMNLFIGDDQGNFNPENGLTRQEAAIIMVRALGLENKEVTKNIEFIDIFTIDDWAMKYVKLSVEYGIFKGYADQTFKPHEIIPREQFVVIIERALRGTDQGDKTTAFADGSAISDWAKAAVKNAVDAKIINGYEDNTFRPDNHITRAEAAKILYSAMYAYGKVN